MAAPTPWDPRLFAATQQSLVKAVTNHRRSLGDDCADASLAALAGCLVTSGVTRGGVTGGVTGGRGYAYSSLGTVDGCCLGDTCAARLVQVSAVLLAHAVYMYPRVHSLLHARRTAARAVHIYIPGCTALALHELRAAGSSPCCKPCRPSYTLLQT